MRTKTILGFLIATNLLLASCGSQEKINEKWYQERWCAQQNGEPEVRLKDRTRCDCLTDDYAIEVDFAPKWAKAIGQSLHYAKMTGEHAGILLIVEESKDKKHLSRLQDAIDYHKLPIRVWTTQQSELE
ncbi:hypothetical protein OAG89_03890 [Pseudomonadales bacterium]|nr:hypothetical protein [Pseudomonadales bacterium]